MMRADGWEQRLWRVTNAALHAPHEWGRHDCALFVADCIQVMTGTDLAEKWRGTYDSEAGALRIMAEMGAESLGDFAAMHLPEARPDEVRRGDVVVCEGPESVEFLAIIERHVCLSPGPDGLLQVPRDQITRGYRVG